jgi:hypothetical protein
LGPFRITNSSTPPNGQLGSIATIAATGAPQPYTWSLTSGVLPRPDAQPDRGNALRHTNNYRHVELHRSGRGTWAVHGHAGVLADNQASAAHGDLASNAGAKHDGPGLCSNTASGWRNAAIRLDSRLGHTSAGRNDEHGRYAERHADHGRTVQLHSPGGRQPRHYVSRYTSIQALINPPLTIQTTSPLPPGTVGVATAAGDGQGAAQVTTKSVVCTLHLASRLDPVSVFCPVRQHRWKPGSFPAASADSAGATASRMLPSSSTNPRRLPLAPPRRVNG